jgi:hypothetical protein
LLIFNIYLTTFTGVDTKMNPIGNITYLNICQTASSVKSLINIYYIGILHVFEIFFSLPDAKEMDYIYMCEHWLTISAWEVEVIFVDFQYLPYNLHRCWHQNESHWQYHHILYITLVLQLAGLSQVFLQKEKKIIDRFETSRNCKLIVLSIKCLM